nr:retrotransposon protein, putative, Ty1-copia subclass [Tanacetum cinerariifolium]
MGKKIGELHALRIEYENGLPKKVATPQVMAIQGGRIHKANKKSLNAKGKSKGKGKGKDKSYIPNPKNPKPSVKEHPTKNDASHHCKEVVHWKKNCPAYFTELIKKKKQVGTFRQLPLLFHIHDNTIWVSERRNQTLLDTVQSMMNLTTFPLSFWDYALESATRILNMVPTKKVDKTSYELCLLFHIHDNTIWVSERRNQTLLDTVQSMMNLTTFPLSFWDYALESATRILNMVPTKKVDKTSYELWYRKVPNLSYLKVWGCEALVKFSDPVIHFDSVLKVIEDEQSRKNEEI